MPLKANEKQTLSGLLQPVGRDTIKLLILESISTIIVTLPY